MEEDLRDGGHHGVAQVHTTAQRPLRYTTDEDERMTSVSGTHPIGLWVMRVGMQGSMVREQQSVEGIGSRPGHMVAKTLYPMPARSENVIKYKRLRPYLTAFSLLTSSTRSGVTAGWR